MERGFSLAKRCYGLGLIRTKLDTTTRSSIALSILAMNINHLAGTVLRFLLWMLISRTDGTIKLLKFEAFQRKNIITVC